MRYQPKRSRKQWLEGAPPYVLACYDSGEKTIDRYTVIFGAPLWDESMGRNVPYLAVSEGGRDFSQWGEMPAHNRAACGRHIKWLDLSEDTRRHVILRATA